MLIVLKNKGQITSFTTFLYVWNYFQIAFKEKLTVLAYIGVLGYLFSLHDVPNTTQEGMLVPSHKKAQRYFNMIFYQWLKPAKALHTTQCTESSVQTSNHWIL